MEIFAVKLLDEFDREKKEKLIFVERKKMQQRGIQCTF